MKGINKGSVNDGGSRNGLWSWMMPDPTLETDKQEGQFLQPQVIHGYRPVSLWGVMADSNVWFGYLLRQCVALTPHPLGFMADLGGTLAFGTFVKYATLYGFSLIGVYAVVPLLLLLLVIASGTLICITDQRTKLPVVLRLVTMLMGVAL